MNVVQEQNLTVRFNDQCVLIPKLSHRHRLPRMVTKSYSLALWKRRSSSLGGSTSSDSTLEDTHVVLRLQIPSFSSKAQSPSHSRHSDPKHLSPCLIQRSSPTSPLPSRSPETRQRLYRKTSFSPSRCSRLVTIPLRPCCEACEYATDASRMQGDSWTEHFSRSARRRLSFSADEEPRTITVEGTVTASSFGLAHSLPINVDEIDKRHRSTDSVVTPPVWLNDDGECSGNLGETSAVQTQESLMVGMQCPLSPIPVRISSMSKPSTPPILEQVDDEDDEDQLFPLPSPRRSPAPSPVTSPSASTSCIGLGRPSGSPLPSNSSYVSVGTKASEDQLLAPPVSRSCSSLSLKTAESDYIPCAPSPHLLAMAPSISVRPCTHSPSLQVSCAPPLPLTPSFTWTEGLSVDADSEQSPHLAPSASVPVPIRSCVPSDSRSSHSHVGSPSSSPGLSNKRPRDSLAMTRSRHMIADVLRGMGAIVRVSGTGGIRV